MQMYFAHVDLFLGASSKTGGSDMVQLPLIYPLLPHVVGVLTSHLNIDPCRAYAPFPLIIGYNSTHAIHFHSMFIPKICHKNRNKTE
jgi:hypothetical protein